MGLNLWQAPDSASGIVALSIKDLTAERRDKSDSVLERLTCKTVKGERTHKDKFSLGYLR